jgi:hypothetical protein
LETYSRVCGVACQKEESKQSAEQLLDICQYVIGMSSARLASSAAAISDPQSPGGLLLASLTAVQRVVAARTPVLGVDDLENLTLLLHNILQQVCSQSS